ncbi:MAG: zinc-binding dehydrogenase [Dehalococcoidia bacterium]
MKGRVAVSFGPGEAMEVREYPVRPPAPGEILVRITAATICGSDLHTWRGEMGAPRVRAPRAAGHEMTGVVAALGDGRRTDSRGRPLAEGDRVVYAYFNPCGACAACITGTAACPNRYARRASLTADDPPHFLGAYNDYYYLLPGQWVFKVPDELPDAMLPPVNCALAQVIQGLHDVGVWLGDTVVIQGAGGLGVNACAVAKEMGAGLVIAVDRLPGRLKLAEAFGAGATINLDEYPTPEARAARVRELTGGDGADVVSELVGVAGVVQEGLTYLRPGGRYLWVGNIMPTARAELIPHDVVRISRQITGVVTYDAWVLPRALDLLVRTRDRYPFDRLISHRYPLEAVNAPSARPIGPPAR